jgi:hypothetical protein
VRRRGSATTGARASAVGHLRPASPSPRPIEAIDEAITKFRTDLLTTEQKLIDGERVEVPVMRIKPRDLALLTCAAGPSRPSWSPG